MQSELSLSEYADMQKVIEERCGICLGEDKAYLVQSRLSGLLAESGLKSYRELLHRMERMQDRTIMEKVIDAIATNETFWFRDRTPWYILEDILLPSYICEFREGKRSAVRIWSAACSSGQEPYSIAMCIDNYLEKSCISDIKPVQFEILATDISRSAVRTACSGRFDNVSISRGLDDTYRDKYFRRRDKSWHICDRIRNAVQFEQFNLQDSFYMLGLFDVVFCRNILIYFSDRLKNEVINKTMHVLKQDGVLFIGSSELLPQTDGRFVSVQYRGGTYFKMKG